MHDGAAVEGHDLAKAEHVEEKGRLVDDDEQAKQRREPADTHRICILDIGALAGSEFEDTGKPAQNLRHGKAHKEDEGLKKEVEAFHGHFRELLRV